MIISAGIFYFIKISPKDEKISYSDELYYSIPDSKMLVKNPDTGGKYVKNELVFEAEDNTSYKQIEELLKKYYGKIVGYIELTNTYQVSFDKEIDYEGLYDVLKKLESDNKIRHISLNHVLPCSEQSGSFYPNDKLWKDEWSSTPDGGNWGFEALQIPEAWQLLKDNQNEVKIGILEVNGIAADHEDLKNNVEDIIGNKYGDLAHGTEVAGIIAAEHNNDLGITGVVPNVRLSTASFLRAEEQLTSQAGKDPVLMTYKVALTYLIAMQKCKIINISLGQDENMLVASHGNQDAISDSELCNNELSSYLKILLENGYDFLICKGAGNLNDGHKKFFKADDNDPNAIFGYIEIKKENRKFLEKYKPQIDKGERIEAGNCNVKYDFFSGITDEDVKKHILVVGSSEQTETGYGVANIPVPVNGWTS